MAKENKFETSIELEKFLPENKFMNDLELEKFLMEPAPRKVPLKIWDMVSSAQRGMSWPKIRRFYLILFFFVGVLPMVGFFPWRYPFEFLATSHWSVKTTGKVVRH